MINVLTSYYYEPNLKDSSNILVSISCSITNGVFQRYGNDRIIHYNKLAPSQHLHTLMYNNKIPVEQYISLFNHQLTQLNPHIIMKELLEFGKKENDVILLCYEKPEDFCHRQLVADWFNTNGYFVEEYKYKKTLSPTLEEEFFF